MYNRSSRGRSYGGGNRNSYRPRTQRGQGATIHESKFIRKASNEVKLADYVPTTSFATLPVDPVIKQNIVRLGYTVPTAIQDQAMTPIFNGKNVVGVANTGTGKTAAFLIPLINKAMNDKTQKVIIIVPTRELAIQIRDAFFTLSHNTQVNTAVCIGGAFMREQMYELRRNPQFIIGTPGRLKDFVNRNVLNLAQFNNVVLDEVDRMLDMGFIADIKYLLSKVPVQRQSLFFSATITPTIHTLIRSFVAEPIVISVKHNETADNVDQDVIRVQSGEHKLILLEELLRKDECTKTIIFGRTKRGVEKLSVALFRKGFKVASIHGDKTQSKRNHAIRLFKEDVVNILVATDVASRGIDIDNISHVINYDQPATYEDYVHRIGRTGRANKKGIALTFVE